MCWEWAVIPSTSGRNCIACLIAALFHSSLSFSFLSLSLFLSVLSFPRALCSLILFLSSILLCLNVAHDQHWLYIPGCVLKLVFFGKMLQFLWPARLLCQGTKAPMPLYPKLHHVLKPVAFLWILRYLVLLKKLAPVECSLKNAWNAHHSFCFSWMGRHHRNWKSSSEVGRRKICRTIAPSKLTHQTSKD